MKTKGYSLWLIPEKEAYSEFASIINKLAKKHNTPQFEPHITLIGEIDDSESGLIDKTKELVNHLQKFDAEFFKFNHSDFYFKSLYMDVSKVKELIDANNLAKRVFLVDSGTEYLPHLSLLYGVLTTPEKLKIINGLVDLFHKKFKIDKIALYKTMGEVEDWVQIVELELKN